MVHTNNTWWNSCFLRPKYSHCQGPITNMKYGVMTKTLISLSLKLIFRMISTFILLYEANSNNNNNFFIKFFDKTTHNLTKKQPQQSFVKAFQIRGFSIYFNARLFKGFQGLYEHRYLDEA